MSLILKWFIRSEMTPRGWFPYKYAEIQITSLPNGCSWGAWPTWCLQRAALLWAQRQREESSLQGLQYERGTSLCTADLEKSQECSDLGGKIGDWKDIFNNEHLFNGESEALCSILPLQFQPKPLLWSQLGWGSCRGSSVGWRGHFANGPFPVITALPKAKCLSQLGKGLWGLDSPHPMDALTSRLEETIFSNIWHLLHAAKLLSELHSLCCRGGMHRNSPHDPNTFSLANLILLFLQ